ncbi:MAG: hypothetical protein VW986_04435 [Gammaproteobacteria bacterium]|jgi:hypothetical protein
MSLDFKILKMLDDEPSLETEPDYVPWLFGSQSWKWKKRTKAQACDDLNNIIEKENMVL